MYGILIKLMVLASLLELGISVSKIGDCSSRGCLREIQRASNKVLRIDWQPISVFPKEARRFREASKK